MHDFRPVIVPQAANPIPQRAFCTRADETLRLSLTGRTWDPQTRHHFAAVSVRETHNGHFRHAFNPLEFALNMALFVPWGMLAVFVLEARRWWLAALLGFALTVTIEVLQIPSARISDPRDLVANSLGALLGIALACIAVAPLRVRPAKGFTAPTS